MPSASSSMACVCTMSLMVTSGKVRPKGLPVEGSISAGPDVPMQPPSTLAQMTKKRLVSMALPGPISVAHQHGVRFPCIEFAIRHVGDRDRRKLAAAIEQEGALGAECDGVARVDMGSDDRPQKFRIGGFRHFSHPSRKQRSAVC